jgi:hypothetical protein
MKKVSKKKKSINPLKKKKKPSKKTEKLDPRVEKVYEDWMELTDPVTGKRVKKKVKITRYKTAGEQAERHVITATDINDQIDSLDDGLHIYSSDDKDQKGDE